MVRLQHRLDPAVEAFDHAIGLRVHRWRQAVLDADVGAKLIELVPIGYVPPAEAEEEFYANLNALDMVA